MSPFAVLASEAVRDAIRRRIVAAIAVLSLLSLMFVDACTSCAAGDVVVNGEARTLSEMAGASGMILFTTLGLWIIVLAGILASDHLQQTLEDGSATLCLSRPVSRVTFALARLGGALAVALAAGAILLGVTVALVNARSGLSIAPAVLAAANVALGAFAAAALAMALSLRLPRLATLLVTIGGVAVVVLANLVALAQQGTGTGTLAWIDRLGPPFASALIVPLAPWVDQISIPGDPGLLAVRGLVWCVIAAALLVWSFQRLELEQ